MTLSGVSPKLQIHFTKHERKSLEKSTQKSLIQKFWCLLSRFGDLHQWNSFEIPLCTVIVDVVVLVFPRGLEMIKNNHFLKGFEKIVLIFSGRLFVIFFVV